MQGGAATRLPSRIYYLSYIESAVHEVLAKHAKWDMVRMRHMCAEYAGLCERRVPVPCVETTSALPLHARMQ